MSLLAVPVLLAAALLPVVPLIVGHRVEARVQRSRGGGVDRLSPAAFLALVVTVFLASGMGVLVAEQARPELRSPGRAILLLASFLTVWGIYRSVTLYVLVGELRRGRAPSSGDVRGTALRTLFLLGAAFAALALFVRLLAALPLFHESPTLRWTGATLLLATSFSLAAPALLSSLWRSAPLETGRLRRRIGQLACEAGVEAPRVRVLDLGTLEVANAWIAGLVGRGRTIFLTKSLLELLSEDEVLAIVGHELGHAKLHHLRRTLLAIVVAGGAGALLPTESEMARQLFQVAFLLTIGVMAVRVAVRRCEAAADDYGARLTGDPASLASALLELHAAAGGETHRSRWMRLLSTHPDVEERVRRLSSVRPRPSGG